MSVADRLCGTVPKTIAYICHGGSGAGSDWGTANSKKQGTIAASGVLLWICTDIADKSEFT